MKAIRKVPSNQERASLNLNIFPTSNLYQTVNNDYHDNVYEDYQAPQKDIIARSKEKAIDHFPPPPVKDLEFED